MRRKANDESFGAIKESEDAFQLESYAKMIFAGKINTEILAALRHRGVEAIGLSGIDGGVVHAERRPPKEVTDKETGLTELADYGHVGDVLEVNTKLVTEGVKSVHIISGTQRNALLSEIFTDQGAGTMFTDDQ